MHGCTEDGGTEFQGDSLRPDRRDSDSRDMSLSRMWAFPFEREPPESQLVNRGFGVNLLAVIMARKRLREKHVHTQHLTRSRNLFFHFLCPSSHPSTCVPYVLLECRDSGRGVAESSAQLGASARAPNTHCAGAERRPACLLRLGVSPGEPDPRFQRAGIDRIEHTDHNGYGSAVS